MLVELCSLPTTMAAGISLYVNIWTLLWLSKRLIIWTEPTNIRQALFLTLKFLTRLKITRYEYIFRQTQSKRSVTHRHNSELQTVLVFKPSTLLSWKAINRYKLRSLYAWWRSKLSWLFGFRFSKLMTSPENDRFHRFRVTSVILGVLKACVIWKNAQSLSTLRSEFEFPLFASRVSFDLP